jgi:hypothetical protein
VIEIPPAGDGVINGSIMDPWQAALEDVGPAGVDKGRGGKYVITPPGYQGAVPDGAIVLPSVNYLGYALLRSILKSGSDADVKTAVAYGQRIKLYPLSQAANPPETVFIDAMGKLYDSTIPYDVRLLPIARPFRAAGAMAGPRQGDDRSTEVDRDREGQAVRSRRADEGDVERGGA